MKGLISKIESNKQYYIVFANQCINELSHKYQTKKHPDGRSLIIDHINFDILQKICAKYGCSGMMLNDTRCVVTNFGYYH